MIKRGTATGPGLPSKVLVVLEKAFGLYIPFSCSLRFFRSTPWVRAPVSQQDRLQDEKELCPLQGPCALLRTG